MNWKILVLSLIFSLSPRSLKTGSFSALWPPLCQQSLQPLSVCLPTRTQYRNFTPKNRQWSSPRPGWWKCFSACSFGLVNSIWHDRPWHTTSQTSSWFRNTRHGPRLVFILPYKPHSVCQHPLLHIRASSHLFRCSTGISPWTCPLHSLLCSSFFYCNWKALYPSSLIRKSAPPHQIPDLFLYAEMYWWH